MSGTQLGSGLTCRDARSLFDAHLDGELSPSLKFELDAHRLNCASCRHELALLEVAGQVVATDDSAPHLDDAFTSRLLACVSVAPQPRWDRQRIIKLGLRGLAAAACLALVVGYAMRPADQVAGFTGVNPTVGTRDAQAALATPTAEERFQAQLERALTGWRKDASSLRKVYEFITPQIVEEMGLDPAEGVHEQRDLFERDAVPARAEPTASADAEIEDI